MNTTATQHSGREPSGSNAPRTLPDHVVEEARAAPLRGYLDRLSLALKRAGGELVGPCPACGGNDRFSINTDKNIYNCRGCGGGDGIGLVQKALGVDFVSAVEFITGQNAREHVIDPAELDRRKEQQRASAAKQSRIEERRREEARRDGYRIWKESKPPQGTLVEDYLRLRGIGGGVITQVLESKQVRFHPHTPYWGDVGEGKKELFCGPAMVSAVLRRDGTFGAAHRTWLDLSQPKGKPVVLGKDGKPLSMKLGRGAKQGGAIRLLHQDAKALPQIMVMGEGIETTLSAAARALELFGNGDTGVAAWCGVDLGNMGGKALSRQHQDQPGEDPRCWICPSPVQHLIYLGDDGPDHKPTRNKLTRGLRRHKRRHKAYRLDLETRIEWAGPGMDFNDLISGTGRPSDD